MKRTGNTTQIIARNNNTAKIVFQHDARLFEVEVILCVKGGDEESGV